jgi:hypothetical protein
MPSKLPRDIKALSGTLRKDREAQPVTTVRTVAAIKADIQQTQAAIAAMQAAIQQATEAITQGVTARTAVTDSNGKITFTDRINPAYKALRESMNALRSFRAYLPMLSDELAAAEQTENKHSKVNIDRLIERANKRNGIV